MHQSIHPTFTLSIRMLKNILDFRGDVRIRVSIKTETCDMGGVHFARNNVLHRVHVRMISSYHTPWTSPCGHQLRSHTCLRTRAYMTKSPTANLGNTVVPCTILRLVSREPPRQPARPCKSVPARQQPDERSHANESASRTSTFHSPPVTVVNSENDVRGASPNITQYGVFR